MKSIIIAIIGAFLFCANPVFAAQKYCLVTNDSYQEKNGWVYNPAETEGRKILKGPRNLPKAWKANGWCTSGLNHCDAVGLKKRGWLPYIDEKPTYNSDTQYLSCEKVIGEDAVTNTYTIHDYTAEEMAERILKAKEAKKQAIRVKALKKAVEHYMQSNFSDWITAEEKKVDDATNLKAVDDLKISEPIEDE